MPDSATVGIVGASGERVDIIGASRGKGFQGVVKRHHFGGGARVQPGEGIEGLAQHGNGQVGHVLELQARHVPALAAVTELGHARDLLGLVAERVAADHGDIELLAGIVGEDGDQRHA